MCLQHWSESYFSKLLPSTNESSKDTRQRSRYAVHANSGKGKDCIDQSLTKSCLIAFVTSSLVVQTKVGKITVIIGSTGIPQWLVETYPSLTYEGCLIYPYAKGNDPKSTCPESTLFDSDSNANTMLQPSVGNSGNTVKFHHQN